MAAEIPVGQDLWIVAKGTKDGKDALSKLKESRAFLSVDGFPVPNGEDQSLPFGSFDNLIKLTDELQKCDSQLDGIVHRLERQLLELDPKAVFKVKAQRQEKTVVEYLQNWSWDESKYPKSRSISENVTFLMSMASKDDEAVRNKTAQFNEAKTQRSNLAKKEGANLLSKDLIDVLTPDVVKMSEKATNKDDWVETEHLTTVAVILAKGGEVEFLKTYESFCDMIVPSSAKNFKVDDKDGNQVWRVVLFKSAVEDFKKKCRDKRIVCRDFEYSEAAYKKLVAQREAADESTKRLHGVVRNLYIASWSDVFCAWIHVKAMRIFVESILRFGLKEKGGAFISFIVTPKPGGTVAARKALADAMGGDTTGDAGDEGEEFFPYVSFGLTPFATARSA